MSDFVTFTPDAVYDPSLSARPDFILKSRTLKNPPLAEVVGNIEYPDMLGTGLDSFRSYMDADQKKLFQYYEVAGIGFSSCASGIRGTGKGRL